MGNPSFKRTFATMSATIDTTGSAGSATGSATLAGVSGLVMGVAVDYNASAPATTTVTLTRTIGGVTENILAVPAGNTDLINRPQAATVDNAGAAISGVYTPYALYAEDVTINIAASDALTGAATVTLILIEH